MPVLHKNITAAVDIHNPKWFSGANNGDYSWKNELGELETTDELLLPSALDFVDASVAPPTTNAGDIYVLASGGSVDAGWGAVSLDDWVRYDGTAWNSITPQKSSLCYDKTTDALQFFDGTNWAAVAPGIQNLDTATKLSLTPSTGDFVYDTDLNSLQRYDGSNWVDIARGYGVISVKSSTGVTTYYTDLQTAVNATADVDTVYIHSDIELTSSVSIPYRKSLTIDTQGHRIWGDTTSADFNLFTMVADFVNTERIFSLKNGGIIETIGTAVSTISAATIYFVNTGTTPLYCYLGNTKIRSINASAYYTNSGELLKGGDFYSTNQALVINSSSLLIEDSFIDCYERPTLGRNINKCTLTSRYAGFIFDENTNVTNCYISGTVTKTGGQNGLAYCYQGTNFYNNVVIADSSTTQPALYVRGISGTNGNISNNIVFNFGTGVAGQWVYGNGYNNYCYAASGKAIDVGNNCLKFVGNTAITNSTVSSAMVCYGTLIQGNTAINLDATNTSQALLVGRTNATTSEIYNNKAEVANASADNIKLTNTGTLYVANNVMGLTGLGLNLNGNTNAMTNVPDAYGNIQIG